MRRFEDLIPTLYPNDTATYYTEKDKTTSKEQDISLLYGEITPVGLRQLGESYRLDFEHSAVIYDLGMGTGKLCLQIFYEYPAVRRIIGIEFSQSRYQLAATAAAIYAKIMGCGITNDARSLTLTDSAGRQLIFYLGSIYNYNLDNADAVIANVNIESSHYADLQRKFMRTKNLTRIATYNYMIMPFAVRFDTNNDYIDVSWNPSGPGYQFNLYEIHHELVNGVDQSSATTAQ